MYLQRSLRSEPGAGFQAATRRPIRRGRSSRPFVAGAASDLATDLQGEGGEARRDRADHPPASPCSSFPRFAAADRMNGRRRPGASGSYERVSSRVSRKTREYRADRACPGRRRPFISIRAWRISGKRSKADAAGDRRDHVGLRRLRLGDLGREVGRRLRHGMASTISHDGLAALWAAGIRAPGSDRRDRAVHQDDALRRRVRLLEIS